MNPCNPTGLVSTLCTAAVLIAALFSSPAFAAVPVTPYEWKPVRIGAGGFVTGLCVHPLDANVRYARTDVANGYRWDTVSQTWLPMIVRNVEAGTGFAADIAAVPTKLGVESLAVDPSATNIVYMAFVLERSTDLSSTHPVSSGALYKSTDAGVTFSKTGLDIEMEPNGDTRNYGERIGVDPANGSVIYYGSVADGLRRSTDGGTTWALVSAGAPAATANVLNINFDRASGTLVVNGQTRTQVVYATTYHGDVFRSADGGQTWTNLSSGIALSGLAAFSTIDADGRFYVISRKKTPYESNGQTLYYYTDSNQVWRYFAGAWTKLQVLNASGNSLGGYGNLASLAIDPANAQRLFGQSTGGALSRSLDGGATWVLLAEKFIFKNTLAWLPQVDVGDYRSSGSIVMDRDGRLWSPQGNEGVLTTLPSAANTETSANPPRWSIVGQGIEELVAHDVIIPPGSGDKAVVSVHDATAFFIDDPDQFTARQASELQDQLISNGLGLAYCPNAPSYVVVSASDVNKTNSGKNYSGYSTDGGRTWQPFASQPSNLQCGTIAVSARGNWTLGADRIVILPSANGPSGSANTPPSYSHDGGKTWRSSSGWPLNADGNLVEGGIHNFSVRQRLLIADPLIANKFYFLTRTGAFYTSTDGGISWTAGGGTGLPSYRFHSQFMANNKQANDLWFADGWEGASAHGLYRSTNAGQSFTRLANVDHAITLALGAGRGQSGDEAFTVYVYGKITGDAAWGVFRSTDAGANWTRVAYNPASLFERPTMMAASWDTFGLLYLGFNGSSFAYGHPQATALPVITQQPTAVTLDDGATATFTVKAADWPTYQWQRQAAGSTGWTAVSDATAPTYKFTSATADNGAKYRVLVTNTSGTTTSTAVPLTLRPLTATATADLANGIAPLSVQFTGSASGGRLAAAKDTTDDGLGSATAEGDTQGSAKAFDNLLSTKWLDYASTSWIQHAYANAATRAIQSYALTSASDVPARDPADWVLLGSNDGTTWTTLDTRSDQTFASRGQRRVFTIATPQAFNRYRLRIDRVFDAAASGYVQLAEIELIDTPAYTYAWSFGDGGTSAVQNPSHTYATEGAYTAKLTVTDSDGNASNSLLVTVSGVIAKLTGTHIGTAGSYYNFASLVGSKAYDGNTATFYDAAEVSGAWTGIDLGVGVYKEITKIRFYGRANLSGRMIGGKFQASNTADFSSGVSDLATVATATNAQWMELSTIASSAGFRYLRYLGPDNANCNVAEIEFYGRDGIATPSFSIAGGTYTSAQVVTLSTPTSGASIRYTSDGSQPSASSPLYTSALTINQTTTLRAIALKDGLTDSPLITATFTIAGFTGWAADPANFPASTSAADRLETADPDGDGLNNLLEYALGGDPLQSGTGILPVVSVLDDKLQLTFTRSRSELTYTVQGSSDLTTWATVATNPGTVSTTTPVTVTDTATLADNPKRFLRLKVSRP